MHRTHHPFFLLALFTLAGCQAAPAPTVLPVAIETFTAPAPTRTPPALTGARAADLAAAEAQLGQSVRTLPIEADGYTLNPPSVYPAARSICLQYTPQDPATRTELYLVQGPLDAPLQPRAYPGLEPVTETVVIGGAAGPGRLTAGVLPPVGVCADNAEWPRYILAWQFEARQFLLYASVQVPPGAPGLTRLELLNLAERLTGERTHPADELDPDHLLSVADAERLAGFDVREPAYLPEGVSFLYGSYQAGPAAGVALFYRLVHPEYGDRGRFFQIVQTPLTPPAGALSCGEPAEPGCELLLAGGTPVLYRQMAGGPESFEWRADGLMLSLFRMAGEPGMVYKEELLKVVQSLTAD